jgi:hypothetical protein
MLKRAAPTLLLLLAVASAGAQTVTSANTQPVMSAHTLIEAIQQHGSSGTSIEPATTPVPMLMADRGAWRLMLHANAFVANTQQQANSERGRDAFFSTNWIMPMAQRSLGANGHGGELTLRTMFSLEPATVPDRNYPELFQQGETAYGNPIVDGQHPHDFFMEVAALYDLPLSPHTLLSFYGAPIGDPAIGPTAYPHRQSASEDIISRTPRTSPSTSSPAASPTVSRASSSPASTAASPTNIAGPSNPAPTATPSTPTPPASPSAPPPTSPANTPSPTSPAPKPSTPARTSSAKPPASCTTTPSTPEPPTNRVPHISLLRCGIPPLHQTTLHPPATA